MFNITQQYTGLNTLKIEADRPADRLDAIFLNYILRVRFTTQAASLKVCFPFLHYLLKAENQQFVFSVLH